MVYNTNNYSFTKRNAVQDKIPNWMDDNFFNTLKNVEENDNVSSDNYMLKIASKYNLLNEKTCKCCNKQLQDDEVNYCKSCINK